MSKIRHSAWFKQCVLSALGLGLMVFCTSGFALEGNPPGDIPELPEGGPTTQQGEPGKMSQMVQQRDQILQQIQQIQQDSTITQAQKEERLLVKQSQFSQIQKKVSYRQKGENYQIARANKQDTKIQALLTKNDGFNKEIDSIMAKIDEHWANTAPVIDERPGMPGFAKKMNLPESSGKAGKDPTQNDGKDPSQVSQKGSSGQGTMDKYKLAAAYARIKFLNSEIKKNDTTIARKAKRIQKITGDKTYDPNRKPTAGDPNQAEPASNSNSVTVAPPNGKGRDRPNDPALAANPECWTTTQEPIAELIPNVVFETGKSDLTDEQAEDFVSQLKLLQTKLQANGHEKLGRVEAISSASFIPRRAAGGNEKLASDRGMTINSNFQAGLATDESLKQLLAPNFSTGLDESAEKEQGPAWNPADMKSKKGVRPTEEQIRAKAEELMQDPNAPFSKTNVDVAVSELKKCCSKDQFDLKYRPHQYAKIKIYGSVYTPGNPECVRTSQTSSKVSDTTNRPNAPADNSVIVAPAQPSNSSPANTSGVLRDE